MSGGMMDEIANAKLKKTVIEPKPQPASNPQDDLMSAIRNANRANLKKASDRKLGELKEAPSTSSAEGQNLMNALVSRMNAIRPSIQDDDDDDDEDWDDL